MLKFSLNGCKFPTLTSLVDVELVPLDLRSLMEVEAPKARKISKTKNVLQNNVDVGRKLHIAILVVGKIKHEIMPKEYNVTSINIGHSSWGQELEKMKMNLETIFTRVQMRNREKESKKNRLVV